MLFLLSCSWIVYEDIVFFDFNHPLEKNDEMSLIVRVSGCL
jgi:hypothetical protein